MCHMTANLLAGLGENPRMLLTDEPDGEVILQFLQECDGCVVLQSYHNCRHYHTFLFEYVAPRQTNNWYEEIYAICQILHEAFHPKIRDHDGTRVENGVYGFPHTLLYWRSPHSTPSNDLDVHFHPMWVPDVYKSWLTIGIIVDAVERAGSPRYSTYQTVGFGEDKYLRLTEPAKLAYYTIQVSVMIDVIKWVTFFKAVGQSRNVALALLVHWKRRLEDLTLEDVEEMRRSKAVAIIIYTHSWVVYKKGKLQDLKVARSPKKRATRSGRGAGEERASGGRRGSRGSGRARGGRAGGRSTL